MGAGKEIQLVHIVLAVVQSLYNDNVLLIRHGDKWMLSGGHTEDMESGTTTLIRELIEEVGVDTFGHTYVGRYDQKLKDKHYIFEVYRCYCLNDDRDAGDSERSGGTDDAKWFSVSEAFRLPLSDVAKWSIEQVAYNYLLVPSSIATIGAADKIKTRHDDIALVVDDDQSVLSALQGVLWRMGFGVIALSDPQVALSLPEDVINKVRIIIADYYMPKVNGFELIQSIKAKNADIKSVILSGWNPNDKGDGDTAFIRKPLDSLTEFKAIINKILNGGI